MHATASKDGQRFLTPFFVAVVRHRRLLLLIQTVALASAATLSFWRPIYVTTASLLLRAPRQVAGMPAELDASVLEAGLRAQAAALESEQVLGLALARSRARAGPSTTVELRRALVLARAPLDTRVTVSLAADQRAVSETLVADLLRIYEERGLLAPDDGTPHARGDDGSVGGIADPQQTNGFPHNVLLGGWVGFFAAAIVGYFLVPTDECG